MDRLGVGLRLDRPEAARGDPVGHPQVEVGGARGARLGEHAGGRRPLARARRRRSRRRGPGRRAGRGSGRAGPDHRRSTALAQLGRRGGGDASAPSVRAVGHAVAGGRGCARAATGRSAGAHARRGRARRPRPGTRRAAALRRRDRRVLEHLDRELVREVGVGRRRPATDGYGATASSQRVLAHVQRAHVERRVAQRAADLRPLGSSRRRSRRRRWTRQRTRSRGNHSQPSRAAARAARPDEHAPASDPLSPSGWFDAGPDSSLQRVPSASTSPAPSVSSRSPSRSSRAQEALGRVEVRQPGDRPPAGGVGGRLGDEPAR